MCARQCVSIGRAGRCHLLTWQSAVLGAGGGDGVQEIAHSKLELHAIDQDRKVLHAAFHTEAGVGCGGLDEVSIELIFQRTGHIH